MFDGLQVSMNRQLPTSSRIVNFEELKRNWLRHQDRIINIKPTINSRPSPTTPLSSFRSHARYVQALEVQIQNKALLKKLTTNHSPVKIEQALGKSRSLPSSNRKKYYQEHKMKKENEGLYRRLKQTRAMIDTSQMLSERRNTQRYISNISKYGYKGRPTQTHATFSMPNNQLKYFACHSSSHTNINRSQQQLQQRNQRLLQWFSKSRQHKIADKMVLLKITKDREGLTIDIQEGKQNGEQLEVQVPALMFERQFKGNLQQLLKRLSYDQISQAYFIQES